MSWREELVESEAAVCIIGPDYYETNAPEIMAEAMRLGKPVILVVPQDRAGPIPPLFGTYAGLKARINIPHTTRWSSWKRSRHRPGGGASL